MKFSKKAIIPISIIAALSLNACTNPTSTAGAHSSFTEGIIMDYEKISINKDQYNDMKSAGVAAMAGAGIGQIIGKDTKSTLVGAIIGGLVGNTVSKLGNSYSDGMRVTVQTAKGPIIVDTLYSCLYRKNAKVRMINRNGKVTMQVLTTEGYRTAVEDSPSKCPM